MQKAAESGMEGEDAEVVLVGRAEIDTRAPFRSVKEAIVLFGERVLAGEVYASKLNEMRAAASNGEQDLSTLGSVLTELDQTKQRLEKAKEDNLVMANSLCSLRDELHKTREELQQLKELESEKRAAWESQIEEDLKFVENATEVAAAASAPGGGRPELERRRYVKFANPPSLAQVIITPPEPPLVLERQFSVDGVTSPSTSAKKKKKPLMPLLAGIFTKKKGHSEAAASPQARRGN